MTNPIICAIDTPDLEQAKNLATDIKENIGAAKLGLEFFCRNGANGVREIADLDLPIFLDLKFHDIPNTVEKAIKSISNLNCLMTTIHMLNGRETIKKCVELRQNNTHGTPMIMGVTILTSHNDIKQLGMHREINDQVLFLAEMAAEEGLDGIVCSPHEIEAIKSRFGDQLKLVCPGIRPEGSNSDDQKRIMTPKQAVNLGANYIVIGRPITASENPKKTSGKILDSLK